MAVAPSMMLLGLAALLVAVVIVVLWPRGRRTTHPVCGQCSYSVEGLESWTCPECGSDLRQVGIFTPAMRHTVGPITCILLWSALLPLPAFIISHQILDRVPMRVISTNTFVLRAPQSGLYDGIDLVVTGSGFGTPAPLKGDLVMIDGAGQPGTKIALDLTTSKIIGAQGEMASAEDALFDAELAARWLDDNGVDVTPEVQTDMLDLATIVQGMADGNAMIKANRFNSITTLSNSSSQPIRWLQPVVIGSWVAVYLIGACVAYLIGKRARRSATIGM